MKILKFNFEFKLKFPVTLSIDDILLIKSMPIMFIEDLPTTVFITFIYKDLLIMYNLT